MLLVTRSFRRLFWSLGCLAALAASADIVINEIHYQPDVKTDRAEFVELLNTSSVPLDLSGWRLAGAVDYTFPNGTSLGAGGYVVVAQDPTRMLTKFGVSALGPWVGALDNSGENIQVLNAAGGVEDEVDYRPGFPWPTVGDPPGYSIELINPKLDNDLGGSWRSSVIGNVATQSRVLLPARSTWRYFKGTDEPSSPRSAWHEPGFDDSPWEIGAAPIGFDDAVPIGTFLADMRYNYSTVYFRSEFYVEDAGAISSLTLRALYDDGFKLWINGQPVRDGDFNMAAGELSHTATAGSALEKRAYDEFNLDSPQAYLVTGLNRVAIQAANSSLGTSTDFYLDIELVAHFGPRGSGPTPGAVNVVYATNAPPQIRQVDHSPEQPGSADPVTITAKITDPDGVASVSLAYQVVNPGSYVELTDPGYTNNWVTVPMKDNGSGGDLLAGDSIYTATIPASVQQHRRLIRYRLSATDGTGLSVAVPYPDDPAPNFAYFCYDGVPAWSGALRPGATQVQTFDTNVMRRLPVIHLISKKSEVEDATWFSRYGGDAYLWTGTLVYDGKVYDHIHYRARGGVWRYAMVKNMWKFDFNNGHDFQMRDDYGRQYKTKWTKLNLGASIQQGDYDHRGEQGMFESVGFRLFNLAGVESPNTVFAQFRIIDQAAEADPATQFEGDFWGVYLVIEQENGRFLDEHGLPDGNFYKMEGGTGELNNLGPLGPIDKSDLNSFLSSYRNSGSPPSEQWWSSNFELEKYYSYQAIVQGIHHYDICYDKNYFYYRNPGTGLWSVHTWDLDLTWADNMYDSGCGGRDDIYSPLLGGSGYPTIAIDHKNRVREIRDLLFNQDQAWMVIDEHARLLQGTNVGLSILEADRYMWDYNPKMANSTYSSSLGKAGQGRFYKWPQEPGVTKDFNGAVQLMKNYVVTRANRLANIALDPSIPAQPVITYSGPGNYPLNRLSFRTSPYSGTYPFAALKWRIGEVSDPNAPVYSPTEPVKYEITPVWESPEMTTFTNEISVPVGVLKVGHAYRARVRMKDNTGRWSNWSAPVQFVAGLPDNAASLVENLRISELMYDPPGGSSDEFIELHNVSSTAALNLEGAAFTSGMSYAFPAGTTLAPGGYLLVIRDSDPQAFRARYGLGAEVPIVGPYEGSLANEGEQLNLKTGSGGSEIVSFEYGNGRGWPVAAQAGHSLVPMRFDGQANGALDYPGNWRASSFIKGSPGKADPEPPKASILINEFAAHTDYSDPQRPEYDSNDWIELYNATASPISLAGWFLSDDPTNLRKFALQNNTLQPQGRLVVDEVNDFHNPITTGFGIDKAGEQLLLSYLPGTNEDRVADALRFKGQPEHASLSRYPDGGAWWFQTTPTRNAANTAGAVGLVLNELMYHPPDVGTEDNTQDEFIEILNPTGNSVTLQDTNGVWRLDGGVGFDFAPGTAIGPGGFLLVVNFDPADSVALNAFRARYGITNSAIPIVGPYSGKLGNRSDRVAIERPQYPDVPGDSYSWIIVDEVIYGNQTPWPATANGSGDALHRVSVYQSGNAPGNWVAAVPSPGQGATFALDTDGDGLPDAWESQHHLDPNDPSDAAQDADGDSMSNLSEYLAGTDPEDPNSALRFEIETELDEAVILKFTAMPDRSYSVIFRGGASTGPWQKLTDVPAGPEERQVVVTDSNSNPFESRFYRIVTPALP